jgi:hypothetical protein
VESRRRGSRYGLFRKGLYADIGYESDVGDDRGGGRLNVVNTAKDAIEAVEPRVHHFFPYEIRCDDGRLIEDYWIFVHRGTIRAFDPIASCFVQNCREDGIDYFYSLCPLDTYRSGGKSDRRQWRRTGWAPLRTGVM